MYFIANLIITRLQIWHQRTKKFQLSEFEILEDKIASGSFGTVSLVRSERSFTPYVFKTISKKSIIKDKQIAHILNEKSILTHFSDFIKSTIKSSIRSSEDLGSVPKIISSKPGVKNIVQLYETFDDTDSVIFLMEYVPGGELANLFSKHRINMKLYDIKMYLAEIVLMIEELHTQNIVYRDLKLENILVHKNGHLKLSDFGFAKKLKGERTYTRWGTEGYIAPEILQNLGHGLPADIWSLGILFCKMISGICPTTKQKLNKVFMLLSDDIDAKDFITNWLSYFDSRPTISDVKKHKFFEDINWSKVKNHKYQPFFVPKLDSNFDTKYYQNVSSNKNKACYISNKDITYDSDEQNDTIEGHLNQRINQDMKNELFDQKCKPLGDFKLHRINKLLKDF